MAVISTLAVNKSSMVENLAKNKKWDIIGSPVFSIIVPTYNMNDTLIRTIESIERQTYKNLEVIIIDDGSDEPAYESISPRMDVMSLPLLLIRKENGGVHTARNVGLSYSRGLLLIFLDADDELLPNSCALFLKAWERIPKNSLDLYFQIKGLCVDQNRVLSCRKFPKDFFIADHKSSKKFFSTRNGERLGCYNSKILQNNRFPEPHKVTFVSESLLWGELESRYLSIGINDLVRVWHKEGDNHLSLPKPKRTAQDYYNDLFNSFSRLKNKKNYSMSLVDIVKYVVKYNISFLFLRKTDISFCKKYKFSKGFVSFLSFILMIPSLLLYKKQMKRYFNKKV